MRHPRMIKAYTHFGRPLLREEILMRVSAHGPGTDLGIPTAGAEDSHHTSEFYVHLN